MTDENDVYAKLAEKYRQVGNEHFLKILKVLVTPEEGEILLELSVPTTCSELAQKLNVDEQSLAQKMDNLAHRGMLFRGKEQYVAWGDSHQLNVRALFSSDENIPPELLQLRREDLRYEGAPFAEINGLIKMYENSGVPLTRVIPARKAIAANPDIRPEQVLWYEDMVEMIKRADVIGVVDCDCRRIYGRCDKPQWVCLNFGKNIIDYETGRGGRMKVISVEEAIAASDMAEEAGLVHETPANNASMPGIICNCCNDCCSVIEPGLLSQPLDEFIARILQGSGAHVDPNQG